MSEEIKINRYNKSLTFINNGIAFSQFEIANEILDLIEDLQQKVEQLENIRKEAIEILKELRLLPPMEYGREEQIDNLLNILNKGSEDNV